MDNRIIGASTLLSLGLVGGYLGSTYGVIDDIKVLKKLGPIRRIVEDADKKIAWSVSDLWESAVSKHSSSVSFIFENEYITYSDMNDKMNKVSLWAINMNLTKDDCVGLFMDNHYNFVMLLIGLAKVGVPVALLNTNIKKNGLIHCIQFKCPLGKFADDSDQVKAKVVLYGSELAESIEGVSKELNERSIKCFVLNNHQVKPKTTRIDENLLDILADISYKQSEDLEAQFRQIRSSVKAKDIFCYIYTSGTTGLPKAALVRHIRPLEMSAGMSAAFGIQSSDVLYGSGLPLYHTTAALAGLSISWLLGCTYVIRRKFSASGFWEDCNRYKVTVVQYIGEIIRYICIQNTEGSKIPKHQIRIAIGSGLRGNIWKEFQSRFKIREIGEMYGSTEGTAFIFNHYIEGVSDPRGIGACGKMGPLLRKIMGLKIVKYDPITETPIKDPSTKRCIEADYGESGELLSEIKGLSFAGYTSKEATQKKIVTGAFSNNDAYFRAGDLLRLEKGGYIYFIDRIGDSFRFKGENVSTNEVSDALCTINGIEEANVYGIQNPGKEGQLCMAGLVLGQNVSFNDPSYRQMVSKKMLDMLPNYAIPRFIRILPMMELTGTFKMTKNQLKDDGFDAFKCGIDSLYIYDASINTYIPYQSIGNDGLKQIQSKL